MTSPWQFTVTTDDDPLDPTHVEITISTGSTEGLEITWEEAVAAHRWSAGVLGRLALALNINPWREPLHTPPAHCGKCSVGALDTTTPDGGSDSTPTLYATVPDDFANHWAKKITTTLELILDADRWQPTAEDEKAW